MEVLRSLTSSDRSVSDVLRGLDVVNKLLGNIIRAPSEQKYRRIRKTNPKIAALLGIEEEGLLRAAGFQDAEEDTLVWVGESQELQSSASAMVEESQSKIIAVHTSIETLCGALRQKLEEMTTMFAGLESNNSEEKEHSPPDFICREASMAQTIECALLDLATQLSADQSEAEKRRRRKSEAESIRSLDWHATLQKAGGSFLLDAGIIEAWLSADPAHRSLAHDLVVLQADAKKWYGDGAERHCVDWRSNLADIVRKEAPLAPSLHAVFEDELRALREAMFEFPEQPGAAPSLFRMHLPDRSDPGDVVAIDVPREVNTHGAVQVE